MINLRKEDKEATFNYSPGLIIILDDKALEKLGIDELPAMEKVYTIHAKGKVISLAQKDNGREMALQITDMELSGEKTPVSQTLYGNGGLKGNINYVEDF